MFSQPYSCETNAASSFEVFYVIYLFIYLFFQFLCSSHSCANHCESITCAPASVRAHCHRLLLLYFGGTGWPPTAPKQKKSRLKAGDKQVRKAAEGDRNIKAQKRWEGRRELKMEGSKQKGSESEDLRKRGRESACVFVCECVCVCLCVCVCI